MHCQAGRDRDGMQPTQRQKATALGCCLIIVPTKPDPPRSEVMNQHQSLPHSVVLVLRLAVLLNYVDRGSLATTAPLLQDELSLSSAQIGLLLSSFFWVYAPAQVLAGWLVRPAGADPSR